MQRSDEVGAAKRAQFVIAVFDDWDALHTVLVSMESNALMCAGMVLHARKDIPPHGSALSVLKETTDLHSRILPNTSPARHDGPAVSIRRAPQVTLFRRTDGFWCFSCSPLVIDDLLQALDAIFGEGREPSSPMP
jgi:hypothetical protein